MTVEGFVEVKKHGTLTEHGLTRQARTDLDVGSINWLPAGR